MILGSSDDIESEPSPVEMPALHRRVVSRSGAGSLNTSIVEQEGKIGGSPK
jgi:hypothetical protein